MKDDQKYETPAGTFKPGVLLISDKDLLIRALAEKHVFRLLHTW